jgi:hypothetical protein
MYNKCGENAKLSSSNGHLVAMEHWSGPERAVAVSAYYRNGDSVIAAQSVSETTRSSSFCTCNTHVGS